MAKKEQILELLNAYKSEVDNFNDAIFTDKFEVLAQDIVKLFAIPVVGWHSEQLPEFDVLEINEILKDCKENKEDFTALICRIWNEGYMTGVADEREG